MSIALQWNRGLRPLTIIACLVFGHKGKSSSSALTGNSDWTGSWGDFVSVWHLALPFDEYFIKFWYPHLQRFQRSSDNCGKIHVQIMLGHPIHRLGTGRAKSLLQSLWEGPWPGTSSESAFGRRGMPRAEWRRVRPPVITPSRLIAPSTTNCILSKTLSIVQNQRLLHPPRDDKMAPFLFYDVQS